MDNNERDTHFLASAELLYKRLAQNVVASPHGLSDVEAFKREQHQIIAQYAYDLVAHSLDYVQEYGNIELNETSESITAIPDLTSWSKTPLEASAPDE